MPVSVQTMRTTDEQISKMMDLLMRRDDKLVKNFFDVLREDGQQYIVDFILYSHNTATGSGVCQHQFTVQQDACVDEVAAGAGQQLNSFDNSETEVKKLVADEASTVQGCSTGSVRNCTADQANLLDSNIDIDCSSDSSVTEVKKLVEDRVHTVNDCPSSNSTANQASLLDSDVDMDCPDAHDSDTLISRTACKVAETSAPAQSIASVEVDVVDCGSELTDHERSEAMDRVIELRQYQRELASPGAEGQNLIIYAPTGSGKTFTAGYICQQRRMQVQSEQRRFKAAFIVCRRHLISQQSNALRRIIGDGIVREADDKLSLSVLSEHFDVIVATAQVLIIEV